MKILNGFKESFPNLISLMEQIFLKRILRNKVIWLFKCFSRTSFAIQYISHHCDLMVWGGYAARWICRNGGYAATVDMPQIKKK